MTAEQVRAELQRLQAALAALRQAMAGGAG